MHPFVDVITVKVDILVNLALLTDGIQKKLPNQNEVYRN